ncbi:MAG: hypothetical protein PHU18_01905, partial [Dehalococcoidales bacterium]|nr:hypothetical protein [Dehalococcoidales bacterium]
GNSHNSNAMLATRNLQQAGHWVSQDILMAGEIIIDDEPETEQILTLTWAEYVTWKTEPKEIDGNVVENAVSLIIRHQVIYNLSDGNLQRMKYDSGMIREDEEPVYSLANTRSVSQFINNIVVIHSLNLYQLEISSTVGGFRSVTEVKVYDINKRTIQSGGV